MYVIYTSKCHVQDVVRIGFLCVIFCFGFIYFFMDRIPQFTEINQNHKKEISLPFHEKIEQPKITLITSYFSLGNKSKHLTEEYQKWMKNFLSWVETPIIIFTQPEMVNSIENLRRGHPTTLQLYERIWDIPFLKDNDLEFHYQAQWLQDPESFRHSPELYAIWNSKSWMLNQGSQLNPYNSTYFYWIDIGSFRENSYHMKHFPNLNIVDKTFEGNEDKIHLFSVSALPLQISIIHQYPLSYFKYMNSIIGGFFGGTKEGVKWFSDTFYKVHDENLEKGEFVGKDQILMNYIASHYPSKVLITGSHEQLPWGGCGDKWFYFQQWYGPKEERRSGCKEITAPPKLLSDILRTIWFMNDGFIQH